MKKQIQLALLVFGTFLFTLALCEIALLFLKPDIYVYRKLLKKGKPYPATFSPTISFTLPKNKVVNDIYVLNEYGFRGKPIPPPEKSSKKRLVVFGDSYTFGVLVKEDETYSAQLQKILDNKKAGIDVINAGYHAGYSPDTYYISLKDEINYYQPDIIVVGLCMNNDIGDVGANYWKVIDEASAFPQIVRTNRNYMNHEGTSIFVEGDEFPYFVLHVPILRQSRFFLGLNNFVDRYIFKNNHLSDLDNRKRGFKRFETSLRAIDSVAKEHGSKLFFMIIPPYTIRFPDMKGDEDYAINFIKKELQRPILDLRTVYEQEEDVNQMFIPDDGHFSVYGNKRVAQALSKAIPF
ncbi:hypothetical protein BVX98_05020 [bacterium F11]|nr:hypothetical protein BVX98_05020 [bacterium F11]